MVSPACYPDGRRYSRLDPPYVYTDRQQRYSSTSEARSSTMTEREPETDTPPRKRIAVACGRCRKRKIRCSGDAGNGLPCQNCKAAGADNCMFLRVASQEAPWVQPADHAFSYELKAARAYQAQNALASPLTTSPTHYGSDIHDGLPRHAGYPPTSAAYSYGAGKYYPSMTSWPSPGTAYSAEDDYATMGYSYPYHGQDPAYLYRMTATTKTGPPAGDLYVNTEAANYGYGSSGATLVHRPAVSEAPNFSLSNVAASLPHAGGGGDRLLPNPSRLQGAANVLAYRTEPSYAASTSTKSTGTSSSSPSPTSAVSEVPASYENSPVSGYPAPSHTLPSMTHMHHHHHHHRGDMSGYPPSSTTSSGDSIFSASEASLRTHGSASELSYKYTDASSSTSSTSSTGSGRRGSGETSSSVGSLANGHAYTVTAPGSAMYAVGRHPHVGTYALLSEDLDAHHPGRRSAGSLSAS